jgi:broad specificity phosphatase PhoE
MTTFFLVRHASMDGLGHRIVGRERGVHLNRRGQTEAEYLASRLRGIPFSAIYSSPMERAQDTANAIARVLDLSVSTEAGLNEIDYGNWTGRTFDEVDKSAEWQCYNACRHTAQIPGGESMPQLLQRAWQTVEHLRKVHGSGVIVLVSHADWIRAAAAHYTGASLDVLQKFDVYPASISILRVNDGEGRVVRWNDTGHDLHSAVI